MTEVGINAKVYSLVDFWLWSQYMGDSYATFPGRAVITTRVKGTNGVLLMTGVALVETFYRLLISCVWLSSTFTTSFATL